MTDAPRYGTIDRDYARRMLATPDEDGPVWMVNLMKYRQAADYADGRASAITGREADDLYTPREALAGIGAEIVFTGDVEEQWLNDEPRWDRIGVVRYPTRRAFFEMQQRQDFQAKHVHKDAAMATTIVIGCLPMPSPDPGDRLVDWSEVPHPPTDEDGDVMIVHVLQFRDADDGTMTPDEMAEYTRHAVEVAAPHGARAAGWFGVEGTILGDGRRWDQVRFNAFPSKRAFMAVATDSMRLAAQRAHREPALSDTYTLLVRPTINRLAPSIG